MNSSDSTSGRDGAEAKIKGPISAKRIHRAKDKQELVDLLTSDTMGVFKEIWRLQLFTALVGVAHKRRVSLSAVDSGKGIDQETFARCPAWPGVLYLIAIAEAGNAEPLASTQAAEDARVLAFEEYSNGGLEMMADFFRGRSADLNGLLEFIETNLADEVAAPSLDLAI